MLNEVIKNILNEPRFITIWLLTPLVLIVGYEIIFWVSKRPLISNVKEKRLSPTSYHQNKPFRITGLLESSFLVSTLFFLIFLCIYIFLIFYKEDFAYIDNDQFTDFSLRGIPFSMPIWRDQGRFWPLGLQEYNFLALLGKSQLVYRSYSIFQLIIVIFAIAKLLDKAPVWYKCLILFFVLINPTFVIPFFGLIYPERNVLLFLILFILAYSLFVKSKGYYARFYMYAVLISAQFCLYYKEPVFVLLGVFGVTRIIINLSSTEKPFTHKRFKHFLKENYIDFGLLVLSFVYFLLYQIEVAPHITNTYDSNTSPDIALFDLFVWWIQNQPILIVFFLVFITRVLLAIAGKTKIDSFQEPLALGAICYFLVYLKLKMIGDYAIYYIAPTLLIATLYLSHFIYQFLSQSKHKWPTFRKFLGISLSSLLFLVLIHQSIQKSSQAILTRKLLINGQVQLVNSLAEYTQNKSDNSFVLFFDNITEKDSFYIPIIFYFSRFLDYNGFHIYNESQNSSKTLTNSHSFTGLLTKKVTLTMKTPQKFLDNKCVSWGSTECFSASNPQKNNLIVLLPGYYTPEYINDLKANSTLLMEHKFSENASFTEKILYKLADQKVGYKDVYLFRKL